METNKTSNRIHPLVAGAAASLILVSLVGVAAITGILPNSHSTASPAVTDSQKIALAETKPATEVETKASLTEQQRTGSKIAADDDIPPAKPAPRPVVKQAKPAPAPAPARTVERNVDRAPDYSQRPTQVAQAPQICSSCGRVESVQPVQSQAQPSGVGVVGGAVLGGLLGNQVGGGNGKALATIAGAVGGGYAGNEVERRTRTATTYSVRVRMEDGSTRSFPYNNQPNWSIGDRVRVVDGYLTQRG